MKKAHPVPDLPLDKNIQSFVRNSETYVVETHRFFTETVNLTARIKTEADEPDFPGALLSSRPCLQSTSADPKSRCLDTIKKKFSELNHAISLENRGLAQIPHSYFSCMTSNVRIIDLRNNKLKVFPDSLSVFKNLESLRLDNNSIQSIPEGVFKEIKPKIFSICNNYLKAVPGEIGLWDGSLESLNLASNFISALPKEIGGLRNLKLLHVNNNSFIGMPGEIGRLTGLRELGLDWFRYVMPGGNIVLNSVINSKVFQLFLGCLREKQQGESFSIKEFFSVFARKMGGNSMKNSNISNNNNNKIMIKQANKLVFEAVFNEDLGVLRYLLSENTDIMKTIDTNSHTPLSYAIQEEKYLSAKLLIQSGADVNCGGGDFASPLNIGVTKMQIYLVKDLFKYGANPNISNKRGEYSLSLLFDEWSIETDSSAYKIFNLLMEHGAVANRRNEEGETPLHRIIGKRQKTALKSVSEYNARGINNNNRFDFTKKTRKKRGCIHLAAAAEDFEAVQIVLANDEVLEQLFEADIEGLRPINLAKKSYSCVKIIRKYEKVYEMRHVLPQKSSKRTALTENSNENIGLEDENESINGTLSMKMRSINVLNAKNSILNGKIFKKTPVRVILDEKRNIEDSNDSIKTDFDEENNSNSSGKKRFEVKKLPLSPNNIKKIERIQKYSQYFTRSQSERIVLQSGRRLTLDDRDQKTLMATARNTTSKVFLANVYKEVINKFEKYHKRLSDLKSEIVSVNNLLSARLHFLFSVFKIHDKLMKIARNLIEKRVSLAIVNINLFESSQLNEEQIKRGQKLGESMQSFMIVFGVLETVLREIEAQNCYDSRVVRYGIARFAGFFGGNAIFGEREKLIEEMAVRFELAQGRMRSKNV